MHYLSWSLNSYVLMAENTTGLKNRSSREVLILLSGPTVKKPPVSRDAGGSMCDVACARSCSDAILCECCTKYINLLLMAASSG